MDTELLTYKEIAERRGIKVESVIRMAKKKRWDKHVGNDGMTRVKVPVEELERPETPPVVDPMAIQVEGLRQTLEAMKIAVEATQARAATAEARVADLIQERDRRSALEARSWWKRTFG
jgi:hypothetical protein